MFLLCGFLFDILFSPFGTFARLQAAFRIIIVLDLLAPGAYRIQLLAWLRQPRWRRFSSGSALHGSGRVGTGSTPMVDTPGFSS
jgi:hypothetical protein